MKYLKGRRFRRKKKKPLSKSVNTAVSTNEKKSVAFTAKINSANYATFGVLAIAKINYSQISSRENFST